MARARVNGTRRTASPHGRCRPESSTTNCAAGGKARAERSYPGERRSSFTTPSVCRSTSSWTRPRARPRFDPGFDPEMEEQRTRAKASGRARRRKRPCRPSPDCWNIRPSRISITAIREDPDRSHRQGWCNRCHKWPPEKKPSWCSTGRRSTRKPAARWAIAASCTPRPVDGSGGRGGAYSRCPG